MYYHERLQGWSEFVGYYRDMVRAAIDGAVFVEVGIWRGRSTIAMGEYIRESGKRIAFTAVDHFEGSEEHQTELASKGNTLAQDFRHHREVAGLEQFINVLPFESCVAAATFDAESCDFVYLDASHDHIRVTDDLNAWWPKIKPGGTLAGHDWSPNWPGVVSAVTHFAAHNSLTIIDHGSTWVIHKPCT